MVFVVYGLNLNKKISYKICNKIKIILKIYKELDQDVYICF